MGILLDGKIHQISWHDMRFLQSIENENNDQIFRKKKKEENAAICVYL